MLGGSSDQAEEQIEKAARRRKTHRLLVGLDIRFAVVLWVILDAQADEWRYIDWSTVAVGRHRIAAGGIEKP